MTLSSTADDPFEVVQEQVQNAWRTLASEYAHRKSYKHATPPATAVESAQLRASRERINAQLDAIEWDLNDLDEALQVAKAEPSRFALSGAQISARTQFLDDMRRKVDTIASAMRADSHPSAPADQRRQLLPSRVDATRLEQTREANERFITDEMQHQQIIMDEQDEDLSALVTAVERIGLMGQEMHDEFEQQNDMLEELGAEMQTTRSRMVNARRKLDQFIAETGPRQFCTIVWLCVIFLVLTVLVVTT